MGMNGSDPEQSLTERVRVAATDLQSADDLDPLMEQIGDARYVLLGEASHGNSDYYVWRSRLSKRLIEEKGFSFIAVEGDWPDCYNVNRYVKAYSGAGDNAANVLDRFARWPTWMWANWEAVALAEWLRRHNDALPPAQQAGFYGLDVYSLWESMEAIMAYLERTDSQALAAAREAYMCFEPYGEDEQAYARATAMVPASCEDEVVDLLARLRAEAGTDTEDREAHFNAERNAKVMVDAERYYRAMVRGGADAWNIRDRHMVDTLDSLMTHHGAEAKAIIWEHNTHLGDARATPMAASGMVNVGQLVRDRHGGDGVTSVGFGSYRGSVIAGGTWGAQMERMTIPEAQADSWEDIFHRAGGQDKLLITDDLRDHESALARRGHRAIGVVYNPAHERPGNYVPTVLPERYDAFIYVDEAHALHPLHLEPRSKKPPETYPWGV